MHRRKMLKRSLLAGGVVLLSAWSNHVRADSHPTATPTATATTGGVFEPPSPPVTPFIQELHRMPIKAALPGGVSDLSLPENGGVAPNGTVYPQVTGDDALTTYRNSLERIVAFHQRNFGKKPQFAPKLFYLLKARQGKHIFHPDPPYSKDGGSTIWGYDGIYPGPTFISRYGAPILVRIFNELYFDPAANPPPDGIGNAQISTHLHNGHTGSESDGNPADIYPLKSLPSYLYPESIEKLRFRDHHYSMLRAGLDPTVAADKPAPNKNDGDIAESVGTLWYHDHSMDFTSQNTYKGLVGFHLLFDDIDSGDEKDPSPRALHLPSGEFDIPLLIQDKRFDPETGQLILKSATADRPVALGVLGDRFVVNGQIQPKLSVLRRKYRLRLLNAGPSRFYQFHLTGPVPRTDMFKDAKDQPFFQIGNDESLLEKRYDVPAHDGVLLSVAERADVVIDFSHFAQGDKLFLANRLIMRDDGMGPQSEFDSSGAKFLKYKTLPEGEGDPILCFEVVGDAADLSRVPDKLRDNPALPKITIPSKEAPEPVDEISSEDLKQLPNHRTFEFDFDGTTWLINGRPFEPSPAGLASLRVGSLDTPRGLLLPGAEPDGEVWTLRNKGKWAHPVHIHLEEFRILRRNGEKPKDYEKSKKDVLRLDPLEEVQIFLRFRDFLGKYPIHCHNVIHEDHEMMIRFDVVGDF
jgi:FtsP/CotA-like multicopper oxidase with cupredoxin domain